MRVVKNLACGFALAAVLFATGVQGQILSINSANLQPRVFNDVPGSTATITETISPNFWPQSITLADSHVSAPTGFANRHVWNFSNNNGVSPYLLNGNDYFSAAFDLILTGSPITPRKEAGWLFRSSSVGDIQFIVNTDGHEVVQFGGISFYSFNANNGITYNSGDTIRLGLSYFMDGNGLNALQFSANGVLSPVFEFPAGQDIGAGSMLGGYFQIVNDPANPNNAGQAVFQRITLEPIPEPSVFALAGFGVLALILRRRSS